MKNLLVAYEGGGYDGCSWEMNFFAWDCDGIFHNIFSTGYAGVKDEDQAIKLLKSGRDDIRFVNLNRQDSIIDFVDNSNAGHAYRIAKHNWYFGEKMKGHCTICGEVHSVTDMIPGGYSSDGGIHISAKDLICPDCYYDESDESEFYSIAQLDFNNGEAILKLGDYHHSNKSGRSCYSYAFFVGEKLLFSGTDYSPSPMHTPDSFDSLVGLLGFLTVKEGDTDDEYFADYTPQQKEFTESQLCDELSTLVMDWECGFSDFDENWAHDVVRDNYTNVWHVGYKES